MNTNMRKASAKADAFETAPEDCSRSRLGGPALVAAMVLAMVAGAVGASPVDESSGIVVDIGAPGDEDALIEGFYQREGPSPKPTANEFFRKCTFRWATNEFAVSLETFPNRHNEIAIRGSFTGAMRIEVGDRWRDVIFGKGSLYPEYSVVIPAEAIGDSRRIDLKFRAARPREKTERDTRVLFAAIDWVRVRPADDYTPKEQPPMEPPLSELPVSDRLRGVEFRPPYYEPLSLVSQLRDIRANAVTIGAINGSGFANYQTDLATLSPQMQPEYFKDAIAELHKSNIAAISWVVFNVQDVKDPATYMFDDRYPQYRMEYIPNPEMKDIEHSGMCLVSSPYIDEHAKLLREIASFDLDGVFFDGVLFMGYGKGDRNAIGCVCQYCQRAFRADTKLDLPKKIDWNDRAFKRWVRWRNERMIATMARFHSEMKAANPDLQITFNWNMWPFGDKDWGTGLPLWKMDRWGVSQHCYAAKPGEQWMMLGYKTRLSHDLNPEHCDVWRTGKTVMFKPSVAGAIEEDNRRKLDIVKTTFLAAFSNGVTPWMSGFEPLRRELHDAVALREPYFSRDQVRHVGVLLSQNTHDFYGHTPDTENLPLYRDGVAGAWLLLSENHIPFEFVFDNQLDAGGLDGFQVIVLPNTAALSDAAIARLTRFVDDGGVLVATHETSFYDEWGDRRAGFGFADLFGSLPPSVVAPVAIPARDAIPKPTIVTRGAGHAVYLPFDPGVAYARERRDDLAAPLLDAVARRPLPVTIEAPRAIYANVMRGRDGKTLLVNLLNTSILTPNGASEFRGIGSPPQHNESATDPSAKPGAIGLSTVPVRNIRVMPRADIKIARARLAIKGTDLKPQPDGAYLVPVIDDHEILILEPKRGSGL